MPPASPEPGRSWGEVCRLIMATRADGSPLPRGDIRIRSMVAAAFVCTCRGRHRRTRKNPPRGAGLPDRAGSRELSDLANGGAGGLRGGAGGLPDAARGDLHLAAGGPGLVDGPPGVGRALDALGELLAALGEVLVELRERLALLIGRLQRLLREALGLLERGVGGPERNVDVVVEE